jgi:hypothetical protein
LCYLTKSCLEQAIAKSKSPTTFAKRQREQDKKRKANEKLAKRLQRKENADRGPPPATEESQGLPTE